jgi:hypothetical protein
MTEQDDPLWRHFEPIWGAIRAIDKRVLLAGGYALFLKQRWLLAQASSNVVSGYWSVEDQVLVTSLLTRWFTIADA